MKKHPSLKNVPVEIPIPVIWYTPYLPVQIIRTKDYKEKRKPVIILPEKI